jgi:4-amino-4-deoxychorismate lyase
VFVVRGNELLTPAVARNGIAGVMRRVVLETAPLVGLVPREADLTLHDLNHADELFVTNALIGIWPVAQLDERAFARGPATVRLMQKLGYGGDA